MTIAYHSPTTDPSFNAIGAWYLLRMNVLAAWRIATGSGSLKIGVVDCGVSNPEIPTITDPYNSITEEADSSAGGESYGHGDGTAGVLAAIDANAAGVAGIAYDSPLVAVACHDPYPKTQAYADGLRDGIMWCVDKGCKVISLSVFNGYISTRTGPNPPTSGMDKTLWDGVKYALDNDVVVVVAAGNEDMNSATSQYYFFPAEFPGAICVGGSDKYDDRYDVSPSSRSNYGPAIDIVAPAEGLYLVAGDSGFDSGSNGTSFSAPMVAAICHLIRSINSSLTRQEVEQLLYDTADAPRKTGGNFATYFPNAAGVANALKAVLKAKSLLPAGGTFPYVDFWEDGDWQNAVATSVSGGVATTTLDGAVKMELNAYSDNAIQYVELYLGTELIFQGLPGSIISATAASAGNPQTLKVKVFVAGGDPVEESYSDIIVDSFTNISGGIPIPNPEIIKRSDGSGGGTVKHTDGSGGGAIRRKVGGVWVPFD